MIRPSVVEEIKRLLAEGRHTQREIARRTGVSRGTVGAIAAGRRPEYEAARESQAADSEGPTGPPQRCRGCGGLVYRPCRLCRVRRLIAKSQVARGPATPEEPLQLELSGGHRTRYEQVRRGRIQAGPDP